MSFYQDMDKVANKKSSLQEKKRLKKKNTSSSLPLLARKNTNLDRKWKNRKSKNMAPF